MHQFAKGVVGDKKEFGEDLKKKQDTALLRPMRLLGHTSFINSVSLSSDGSLALSGSADKMLGLWDMKSGKHLKMFSGHTADILSVSLSSDGGLGLSGSDDKTVRLWDMQSGMCLLTLEGHTGFVRSISLSSDGSLALSGSYDDTLRLWDMKSGKCLRTLSGHTDDVESVSLSSDGNLGLSGSDDKTLRLWDIKSGKCLKMFSGHTKLVKSVSLSSDSCLALSGSYDETLRLWDIKSGNCLRTLISHPNTPTSVSLISDGSFGLSGGWGDGGGGILKLWDMKSGKCWVINYPMLIESAVPHIHNDQLYALTALNYMPIPGVHNYTFESNYVLDFRHICALPQATQSVLVKPVKPPLQLVQPRELFQPLAAPAKKPLQEKKEAKEDAEIQITGSYKISYNSLKFGDKLGEGGFGIVYRGTLDHDDVAIKQIKIANVSEEAREEFEAEVQVMSKLHSKYIVHFYGYCLSPQYTLVMEYMPKGSLTSLLLNKKIALDVDTRTRLMTEMACGLSTLHVKNILHRDIKSLNVLLDEQFHAKFSDFGLSKIKNETRTSTKSVGGTLQWMAPELLSLRPKHTKKSDIYSLGMTFWEIAARSLPYNGAAEAVIKDSVKQGEREQIPGDCPKRWATVIQACWEGDPNKRPESDDIVAYFKSGQDDFKIFLPKFKATQANQNNLVPLNSGVPGIPSANFLTASGNPSSGNSSFNRELMGNLASRST